MIPSYLVEAYKERRITRTKIAKLIHTPLPKVIASLRELGVSQLGQGVPLVGVVTKEERNRKIYERFQAGVSVLVLKEEYYMTAERIRVILEEERAKVGAVLRVEPKESILEKSGVPDFTIPEEDVKLYLAGKIGLDTTANKYKRSLREVHTAAKYQSIPLRHLVHKQSEALPKPVKRVEPKTKPVFPQKLLPKKEEREGQKRFVIPGLPWVVGRGGKPFQVKVIGKAIPDSPKPKTPKVKTPKPPKHKSLLPYKIVDKDKPSRKGKSSAFTEVVDKIYVRNRIPVDQAADQLRREFESRQWYKGVEVGVSFRQIAISLLVNLDYPQKLLQRRMQGSGWRAYPVVVRYYKTGKQLASYVPFQQILCHYCEDFADFDLKDKILRHKGRACCAGCYLEKEEGELIPCSRKYKKYRSKNKKPKKDDIPPSWDTLVRAWEDEQSDLS